MNELLNCPNCGAPIQDDICPYCGSVFLDWACFDMNRPTFVKVKDRQGRILCMKLSTPQLTITIHDNVEYFYANNVRIPMRSSFPDTTIEAEFQAVPFFHKMAGKDVLYILIEPDKANDDSKREVLQEFKKGEHGH